MIIAKVRKENEWQRGQVEEFEIEFEKIGEIEHYLAYHRAYIRAIEFEGKIQEEEE